MLGFLLELHSARTLPWEYKVLVCVVNKIKLYQIEFIVVSFRVIIFDYAVSGAMLHK